MATKAKGNGTPTLRERLAALAAQLRRNEERQVALDQVLSAPDTGDPDGWVELAAKAHAERAALESMTPALQRQAAELEQQLREEQTAQRAADLEAAYMAELGALADVRAATSTLQAALDKLRERVAAVHAAGGMSTRWPALLARAVRDQQSLWSAADAQQPEARRAARLRDAQQDVEQAKLQLAAVKALDTKGGNSVMVRDRDRLVDTWEQALAAAQRRLRELETGKPSTAGELRVEAEERRRTAELRKRYPESTVASD